MSEAQAKVDAIAKRSSGANTIAKLLSDSREQIARALPKHMDADRMTRVALTVIRSNRSLLECTPMSLIAAVMEASQLGLELGGVLGQAYLVPYRNKGVPEAQMQVGYRGLIALAARAGAQAVSAEVVRERDRFAYRYGTDPMLEHVPALRDAGDPVCVWASVHLGEGKPTFRVLTLDDIDASQRKSKGADKADSPWRNYWDEMARKTALRSVLKYAPMRSDVIEAVTRDEYREAISVDAVEPPTIEAHADEVTNGNA